MAKGIRTEIDRKHNDMLKYYNKLCDKKTPKGKRELDMDAIIEKVAYKFYLGEKYTEAKLKELLRK